jgi:hypothetical protein
MLYAFFFPLGFNIPRLSLRPDFITIKTICELRNSAAPQFAVVSFRHKGIRQHSVLEQLGLRSSLNILNMTLH